MMEAGKMISIMEMVYTMIQMEIAMKVNLLKENIRVTVPYFMQINATIKEILLMERNMEMEPRHIPMEAYTQGNFRITAVKAKEF